ASGHLPAVGGIGTSHLASSPSHDEDRAEDWDGPAEEIDESDYSEEYEDDFEDAQYTEDEDQTVGSDIEEVYMKPGAGALSMVREEEDLSRVMSNYEQDLARHHSSASPVPSPTMQPRRTGSLDRSVAAPEASRGTLAIPIMELRSRMKEELIRKMGEEPFEKAFNFLLDARMRGIPESAVKRDLEALVGLAPADEALRERRRDGRRGEAMDEPESWIMVNDALDLDPQEQCQSPSPPTQREPVLQRLTSHTMTELEPFGFYGHLTSFDLQPLTPEQAESIHHGLGQDFTKFCRLTMKGPEDYRTIRLEPSIIQCQPAEAWHAGRWKPPVGQTWSFTFALAVEKSANCFVNVGLVEWVAARKDSAEASTAHATSPKQSLAEILQVKSEAEDNVPGGWLPEQHVHENPRQMMLGCRKGVQWFGNAAKFPLFQDNIMEGSLLRFRCDYHLNRHGEIAQVKVWFLPSPLNFEYGGEQTITESDLWFEPLAQWWEPRCQDKKMRSLWVPAVTLYTCDDVVTVAWNGPDP
ncbi:E3 ubiquitin-protein ligase Mdm2, partial [Durusdinium trenchii]